MITGIGIEIVEVSRFEGAMERRGRRLLERLFTGRELKYCLAKPGPGPHLAARFAAKTAFFKAAGIRLPYRAVEVRRDKSGQPSIGGAEEAEEAGGAIKDFGNFSASLTITHTRDIAMAVVILEKIK